MISQWRHNLPAHGTSKMIGCDDGMFVLYADHLAEVAKATEKLQRQIDRNGDFYGWVQCLKQQVVVLERKCANHRIENKKLRDAMYKKDQRIKELEASK